MWQAEAAVKLFLLQIMIGSALSGFSRIPLRLNKQDFVVKSINVYGRSSGRAAVFASVASASLAAASASSALQTPSSVTERVVKRDNDDRQFEALTLANGLRVLLVSDSSSLTAAAAVDVRVGSLSDPPDLPGLAHFCEHMSFLGTAKYPREEEYGAYLAAHGGSSNAYTDNEDTAYYFECSAEDAGYEGALDRFAQFFLNPLFTPGATARELRAVDSEHSKNVQDDGFRLYQLDKEWANPAHPLHQFATGNKETLETRPRARGTDVRRELLAFHAAHYSAGRMTACLAGPQPLDLLRRWARRYFEPIKNTGARDPALAWWGVLPPYQPQPCAQVAEVVPVGDLRLLTLSFPVPTPSPARRAALLALKPDTLLAHLVGHEGEGSLASALRARNWASGLQAAVSLDTSDVQLFEVVVELTEEGLEHRWEVAEAVFSYLQLLGDRLAAKTLPLHLPRELGLLSALAFQCGENKEPADLVSGLAGDMQLYSPAQYLTGPRVYPALREGPGGNAEQLLGALEEYMAALKPAHCRIKVVSKAFSGATDIVAEHYGTQYALRLLERETAHWSRRRADPSLLAATASAPAAALALPQPNSLLPRSVQLLDRSPTVTPAERAALLRAHPVLLRRDERWTMWHKQDRFFRQPKTYLAVSLAAPASLYSPALVVATRLLVHCLYDQLAEFLYEARLAGLSLQLELASRGLQLTITGYSDRLADFTVRVATELARFVPASTAFARARDDLRREYESWSTQPPYAIASYYASLASESLQFEVGALRAALEGRCSSPQAVTELVRAALARSHGTVLAIGNIDSTGAEALLQSLQSALSFAPLPPSERALREVYLLPHAPSGSAGYRLSNPGPNPAEPNSAVTYYFQQPLSAPPGAPAARRRTSLLVELLAEIIEQPFYTALRTQQQLGYIVQAGARARQGVLYLTLTAQSSSVSGEELVRRIESFLASIVPQLQELPAAEFEQYRAGLISRKAEPDRRLTGQAGRFWSEILLAETFSLARLRHRYPEGQAAAEKAIPPDFDRYEKEVRELESLSVEQFRAFVKSFLPAGAMQRRLLISEVEGTRAMKRDSSTAKTATSYVEVPAGGALIFAQSLNTVEPAAE